MTSTAVASYQPSPAEPAPRPGPGAADALPVFAAEGDAADGLGRAATAALLAEVVLHRRAGTPLALGILGPAGSGKSRFLDAVLGAAGRLAEAAARGTDTGPFLSRIVAARVVAVPGRSAAALLVGGVIEALSERHGTAAEEAVHAGGDPREAARRAGDRMAALRRTLDGERQSLDDLGGRRARLTETVLFEGAGSRIDGYARANRARIEARLRAFGFSGTDPIRSYKELVRAGTEAGGSRLGLTLKALWGFKGQGKLLVLAALLGSLGWAASANAGDPAPLDAWLAGFGDRFAAATDGLRAHLDLLQPIGRIALALAALALLADAVRAARFLGPVFRGIALLKGDLAARRRELDGLLAHQTRRVDGLAAEAEAAGRGAEAAQRRIEGRRDTGLSEHGAALAAEVFGLARAPDAAAEGFFARLSEGTEGAPERILVAVDGLDRLPPVEAAAFLETAHRLVGRPGFVLLMALDREQAAAALGEFDPAAAAARLDRILQLTYDLGAEATDAAALAERLLDPRVLHEAAATPVDASRSALDTTLQPFESDILRRLAIFAGGTPRGVKRFVNAYRVARADPRLVRAAPATLGMLALSLAVDGTGAGSELAGFDGDIASGKVTVDQKTEFGRAFATVIAALGQETGRQEVGAQDMRRGLAVARSYGRRG